MHSVTLPSSATCRAPVTQPSVMERSLAARGDSNVAVGAGTGGAITTSSNVIAIGAGVLGDPLFLARRDNSCYIGNIHGRPVDPATAACLYSSMRTEN